MTRKRIAKVILLSLTTIVVAPFLIGYLTLKSAYLRGEFAAYNDVRHGRYRELGYGLPAVWRKDGITRVHRRYPEAEFVPVAGCMVSFSLQQYVDGYNTYAQRATIEHFGHDVFSEAFNDARKQHGEIR